MPSSAPLCYNKVGLPRDHDQGREEVGFAGRADQCLVRGCFLRFVAIICQHRFSK